MMFFILDLYNVLVRLQMTRNGLCQTKLLTYCARNLQPQVLKLKAILLQSLNLTTAIFQCDMPQNKEYW